MTLGISRAVPINIWTCAVFRLRKPTERLCHVGAARLTTADSYWGKMPWASEGIVTRPIRLFLDGSARFWGSVAGKSGLASGEAGKGVIISWGAVY